jgi:hypothetical protein
MKKAIIVLILAPFACSPVYAGEVAPIEKGEIAPFSGQLLTTEKAIILLQKAESCETLVEIEKERLTKLNSISLNLANKVSEINKKVLLDEITALEDRILFLESSKPPWHKGPGAVMSFSILGTIGVLWLSTYAVSTSTAK